MPLIDVPLADGRLRSDRCLIMGILNATPDSFSDGGELEANLDARIAAMARADIIDVGGESTRPGHLPVPARDEIARVVPVIKAIRNRTELPISIDTQKASVAQAALAAGASMVNDVSAGSDAAMARVVKEAGCAWVLMRHGDLAGDVVAAARNELAAHIASAVAGGVDTSALIMDPGLGFGARPGASVEDNLALIDGIASLGPWPVLVGASRKRFVGTMMNEPVPAARVAGSVAMALRARAAGAAIVRVHDVAATRAAL